MSSTSSNLELLTWVVCSLAAGLIISYVISREGVRRHPLLQYLYIALGWLSLFAGAIGLAVSISEGGAAPRMISSLLVPILLICAFPAARLVARRF